MEVRVLGVQVVTRAGDGRGFRGRSEVVADR
jgi:hypothetical protein